MAKGRRHQPISKEEKISENIRNLIIIYRAYQFLHTSPPKEFLDPSKLMTNPQAKSLYESMLKETYLDTLNKSYKQNYQDLANDKDVQNYIKTLPEDPTKRADAMLYDIANNIYLTNYRDLSKEDQEDINQGKTQIYSSYSDGKGRGDWVDIEGFKANNNAVYTDEKGNPMSIQVTGPSFTLAKRLIDEKIKLNPQFFITPEDSTDKALSDWEIGLTWAGAITAVVAAVALAVASAGTASAASAAMIYTAAAWVGTAISAGGTIVDGIQAVRAHERGDEDEATTNSIEAVVGAVCMLAGPTAKMLLKTAKTPATKSVLSFFASSAFDFGSEAALDTYGFVKYYNEQDNTTTNQNAELNNKALALRDKFENTIAQLDREIQLKAVAQQKKVWEGEKAQGKHIWSENDFFSSIKRRDELNGVTKTSRLGNRVAPLNNKFGTDETLYDVGHLTQEYLNGDASMFRPHQPRSAESIMRRLTGIPEEKVEEPVQETSKPSLASKMSNYLTNYVGYLNNTPEVDNGAYNFYNADNEMIAGFSDRQQAADWYAKQMSGFGNGR